MLGLPDNGDVGDFVSNIMLSLQEVKLKSKHRGKICSDFSFSWCGQRLAYSRTPLSPPLVSSDAYKHAQLFTGHTVVFKISQLSLSANNLWHGRMRLSSPLQHTVAVRDQVFAEKTQVVRKPS